jgi:hypothetical protein
MIAMKTAPSPRLIATIVALAVPALAYVVFVARFGVNVPFYDDFGKLPIFHDLFTRRLSWNDVWGQQNEHRLIVTLLLLELPVATFTHYDTRAAMIVGALVLVATCALLVWLWLRSPAPLWTAIPIVALLCSPIQFANSLFDYENVYLGLFGVVLTLFFLEGSDGRPRFFWFALASAVLTSYTEFQGLFVWLAGIPYFAAGSGAARLRRTLWALAAVLAIAVYFIGYSVGDASATSPHPSLTALPYVLTEFGALFTGPSFVNAAYVPAALLIGLVLASLAAYEVFGAVRRLPNDPAYRLPLALLIFGLVHVLINAAGRAVLGLEQAASSRYTSYTLVLIAAVYMLTQRALIAAPGRRSVVVAWATIGIIAIQWIVSWTVSWPLGATWAAQRREGADVFVNYAMASDRVIESYLWCCAVPVRERAAEAEADGLSVFSTRLAPFYRQIGIVPGAREPQTFPVPPAIARAISTDEVTAKAFTALAAVYAEDPDVRVLFGAPDATTAATLIHWAANDVPGPAADDMYLGPFREVYAQLDRRLATGAAPAGKAPALGGETYAGPAEWNLSPPFTRDPALGTLRVAAGADLPGKWFASSPEFFVASGRSYRFAADVDAHAVSRGHVCVYAASMPSGVSVGMTCVPGGARPRASVDVKISAIDVALRWAVYVDDVRVGPAPLTLSHIRVDPLGSDPRAGVVDDDESIGLDTPAGRARWYVPPGMSLDPNGASVTLHGTGKESGNLYATSKTRSVLPGREYTISAFVYGRAARLRPPCFYLAEIPSGAGIGMTCAKPGTSAGLTATLRMPSNVWLVQWVAFTNDTTLPSGKELTYSRIAVTERDR